MSVLGERFALCITFSIAGFALLFASMNNPILVALGFILLAFGILCGISMLAVTTENGR